MSVRSWHIPASSDRQPDLSINAGLSQCKGRYLRSVAKDAQKSVGMGETSFLSVLATSKDLIMAFCTPFGLSLSLPS
jgi:hypothetical protein